jgi:hypothetical protein
MLPLLADVTLPESVLLAAGAAALAVTVTIARAWSKEARYWGRVISGLRSDNSSWRRQVNDLFDALQICRSENRELRRRLPPGDSPGPAAGGPGQSPP